MPAWPPLAVASLSRVRPRTAPTRSTLRPANWVRSSGCSGSARGTGPPWLPRVLSAACSDGIGDGRIAATPLLSALASSGQSLRTPKCICPVA